MISAYTILKRYGSASCLAFAVLLLVPFAAGKAQWVPQDTTYTVTTLVDELDGDLLPATGSGTSLREAVVHSDIGDQRVTIVFDAALTGTIFLLDSLGDIPISHYVVINGPGSETIEVNGNDLSRIFNVSAGDSLDMSGLTLASGRALDGAAIYSEGWLSISNSVLRWSTAINSGGAIYHNGSELMLTDCRIERCEAYRNGGAIAVMGGPMTVSGGIFVANTARYGGGAIYLDNSASNGLSNTSVSDNIATGDGGAISILTGTTLLVSRSTVSDNRARNGAGIDNDGILDLENATISGNSAGSVGGGVRSSGTVNSNFATFAENGAEAGGGVFKASGTFISKNTIFGDNSAPDGPNVKGNIASDGNNLVAVMDGSSGWISSDIVGTDSAHAIAGLAALHFNGGVTKTHALLECSQAVDAAGSAGSIVTDQRGLLRTVNGDNASGAVPDIGAFEAQGILDIVDPVINTYVDPATDTLKFYLDATGQKRVWVKDFAYTTDNCTILDSSVNVTAFTCADVGRRTVTVSATDRSYKTVSRVIPVQIIDNTPPELTAPADIVAYLGGSCTKTLTTGQLGAYTATDNCSAAVTNDSPGTFGVGVTQVRWTATDPSGNATSRSQFITIVDTTRPTITAPPPVVAYTTNDKCYVIASQVTLGTPTASDNCSYEITNNAPSQFGKFTTVIWTVTDASGNVSSAAQTVTVIDATPPTINAPADLALVSDLGSCDRNGATVNLGVATAFDNCGSVTITNNKPSVYLDGVNVVTWTATDEKGLQTTVDQIVTIFDGNPPTIVAPADIEVPADSGTCGWTVVQSTLGTATSTDNCGVPTATNSAGSSLAVGTHRVIWTATDDNGNQTTDVQIVTVVGDPPAIVCVPDITVNTDLGKAGAVVTYTLPTATSVCSDFELLRTSGPGSGDFFPVGTTNVAYMAIDGSNQIDVCDFNVTVVDNEPPQIDVAVAPRHLWPADNKMYEIKATVVVTDNVPGATFVLTSISANQPATGDIAGQILNTPDIFFELRAKNNTSPRLYTITYTATDAANNTARDSATVSVPTVKPKDFEEEILPAPSTVSLAQNYPNPFNPSTLISFGIPTEQHVELRIYNAMGMPVRTLVSTLLSAGTYTTEWDGNDDNGLPLSSGVYLYMIRGGSDHLERKMILAR